MTKLSIYESLKRLYNALNSSLTTKINGKSDKVQSISVANSVASQTLAPNTLYVFELRTSNLTLSLGTAISGIANEYHLILNIGSTAPTITWPSGISWNGGDAPTISANTKCEVSILDKIATFIMV